MKKDLIEYVCPLTKSRLNLQATNGHNGTLADAVLISVENQEYTISDGIPCFITEGQLSEKEKKAKRDYEEYYTEEFYTNATDWLFKSFHEDEEVVREKIADLLELKKNSRVLEVGCGTGSDTLHIARRLGPEGVLFVQDISGSMVSITRRKLMNASVRSNSFCQVNYFVSSARSLPFPDRFFDVLFHFGGFNNFEDPKQCLEEFSRVVKEGGKVVFGDESIPPWLENTEFADIVCTNNPLFRHKVPLSCIPACARDVAVRWILGNCFYLIDFTVGSGPPALNLDLPHQGRRGGTMRTRYFGQLEGVTVETKELVLKAAERSGETVHDWLEKTVRAEANKNLGIES